MPKFKKAKSLLAKNLLVASNYDRFGDNDKLKKLKKKQNRKLQRLLRKQANEIDNLYNQPLQSNTEPSSINLNISNQVERGFGELPTFLQVHLKEQSENIININNYDNDAIETKRKLEQEISIRKKMVAESRRIRSENML